MVRSLLLGIDIGTSACKALLLDDQGQVIAKTSEQYAFSIPRPGWAEQNPEDWWKAVKICIRRLNKNSQHSSEIKGIGLSGQMHGLVALDSAGTVLRPCILWNDQRAESDCKKIYDLTGGLEGLLTLTNNRMLPGYTGGKILWMRENEPHIHDRIEQILNPKDYIRLLLTGEVSTEVSDASGTGLFDVAGRKWSRRLLDLLQIPRDWLPRCINSTDVSGRLLDDVASELGLSSGVPVVGGGGDAVVQAIGTGVLGPGILGTTIGTAGNVVMSLDKCHENPNGRLQIFCSSVPGKWVVMGVTLAAGGSLSWLGQIWEPHERKGSRIRDDVYEILMREAAAVSPGSEGLIFLPYLMGERSPHVDPTARGAFIGLTQRHTKKHLVRSILEGVIFSLKDVSELIHTMGMSWSEIRTSGGAARSKLWRQIHADVFNEEVTSMREAAEGAAFGAAILAGVGIGIWSSVEEIAKELSIGTKIEPVPENVAIYEILFSIYRDLYPSLQSIFHSISATYQ